MKNVCIRCGRVFEAKNKLAKYCPECRKEVMAESKRKWRRKSYKKEREKLGLQVKQREKLNKSWWKRFNEDWLKSQLYD